MATTYKVLGQLSPVATTNTALYTVPSATSAICSTLAVTNLGVSTTFRVAVCPAGAALVNQHYIVYDSALSAGSSVYLTIGVTLAETDVITVFAGTSNVTFNLFGSEVA
jgi:hypothetical protein